MQSVGEINARPWDFLHSCSKTTGPLCSKSSTETYQPPPNPPSFHIYVMNASILNPWTYYAISMEIEYLSI